ncbi:MAG: Orotate phosphoribosyltransferase, partial [uncultured Ramlibacter sp.]
GSARPGHPGAGLRAVRRGGRRAALRRIQDQGGPPVALLLQRGAVRRRRQARPAGAILCKADHRFGHRVRPAVRSGLQGHPAGRGGRHRAGPRRPQRAVCVQPQGNQGPRRRRQPGRRTGERPCAGHRRRDVRRHRRARVDRADPGCRRHAACRGHRPGPAGEGHRERAGRRTQRRAVRARPARPAGVRHRAAGRPAALPAGTGRRPPGRALRAGGGLPRALRRRV